MPFAQTETELANVVSTASLSGVLPSHGHGCETSVFSASPSACRSWIWPPSAAVQMARNCCLLPTARPCAPTAWLFSRLTSTRCAGQSSQPMAVKARLAAAVDFGGKKTVLFGLSSECHKSFSPALGLAERMAALSSLQMPFSRNASVTVLTSTSSKNVSFAPRA